MDHQAFAQLLGNYGEFIGSVAVLGTLIYLAIQIRHSKELIEKNHAIALSQVQQARADSGRDINLLLSDSTHLATLVAEDIGTDEKTVRLRAYFTNLLMRCTPPPPMGGKKCEMISRCLVAITRSSHATDSTCGTSPTSAAVVDSLDRLRRRTS